MPDFPFDVIVVILLRLPVKPLLRFSLILENYTLSSVNFESLDNAVELDNPLKSDDFLTVILGSCDGLICLINNGERELAIWNPSTRRCQKLPFTEDEYPGYATGAPHEIYGFGYDSVTDDYKLARFVQFLRRDDRDSFGSFVKVYSMKSNSWRRIEDFPYYLHCERFCGVLVCSALHWVVGRNLSDTANSVAAFDLTSEDYKLVPQPEFSDNTFRMNIAELGGCLCILCNHNKVRVDVWVMKDYGVKESWKKLFSVAQPEVIRSFKFVIPLAYSKSGVEVLLVQDYERLVCLVPLYGRGALLDEQGETYGPDKDDKRKEKDTPNKMINSR
ncbi:hypothetical protein Vadar_024959 [Vaccinium darrowii]|uniref:Uncharacterized protein n=1 Tax=Vaccinium darrowii TaxID=229202 RepID=A0ACB7XCR6_9ERIC|nr:hypothetical protein Vadar_024959 [Vaccinium darrowii]